MQTEIYPLKTIRNLGTPEALHMFRLLGQRLDLVKGRLRRTSQRLALNKQRLARGAAMLMMTLKGEIHQELRHLLETDLKNFCGISKYAIQQAAACSEEDYLKDVYALGGIKALEPFLEPA